MPTVVITGGHSAGHIEPAMNVADAVRTQDASAFVLAIGTERGLDSALIPARGYPLELIPPVPLPRKINLDLVAVPYRLRSSVHAAGAVLDRVRADVVVGFGGYVALPVYLAARRRRIPIVLHEANIKAGLANRVGARLGATVFSAQPVAGLPQASVIGMPLRPAIMELNRAAVRSSARVGFGLRPDLPTLLVTGGSQGAQRLNGATMGAADAFAVAGIQVVLIAGPTNPVAQPVRSAADDHDLPPFVVLPFVKEMAQAYAAADLVLCRSGAMTVAELGAVGLPAAFVPFPLRGAEQGRNADPMVAAGAALRVDDAQCTPAWVKSEVITLMGDQPRLQSMAAAATAAGRRDAATIMAEHVLRLASGHRAAEKFDEGQG